MRKLILGCLMVLLFSVGVSAAPKIDWATAIQVHPHLKIATEGVTVQIFPQVGGGHNVQLTWSDTDSGTQGIGYNVYKAQGACSSSSVFAKVNSTPLTVEIFTDSTVTLGSSQCYQVTAALGTGESGPSNQVT